jgi:uncharacterized delta-60 repeat protein
VSTGRQRGRRRIAALGVALTAAMTVGIAAADPRGFGAGSASSHRADRWSSSTVDIAFGLARERDGKLVAAGLSARFGYAEVALARYTVDGRLDRNFASGGTAMKGFGSGASAWRAAATQADGRIVAAGGAGVAVRGSEFAIARYTAQGKPDRSFGRSGAVLTRFGSPGGASYAEAVAVQPDGKVVAAGSTLEDVTHGPTHVALARYTPGGSLDPDFGRGGRVISDIGSKLGDYARCLALQPDGKLVVAGTAYLPKRIDLEVARFTARGALDPSFGTGGRVLTEVGYAFDPSGVVVQPDGKLVVAGTGGFQDAQFALVRYSADGKLDPSFGNEGKAIIDFDAYRGEVLHALAIQPDGKLVAAGAIEGEPHAEEPSSALARLTPSGSLDPSFGRSGEVVGTRLTQARAVAIQPDGKIVAAGNSHSDFGLVRYLSNGSLDASFGHTGLVTTAFGSLWTMLASMSATRLGGDVVVRWRTASEGDARGFTVYRGRAGHQRRVSHALIRAKGGRGRGAAYFFRDRGARASAARYWVQEVAVGGPRRWLGQGGVRG